VAREQLAFVQAIKAAQGKPIESTTPQQWSVYAPQEGLQDMAVIEAMIQSSNQNGAPVTVTQYT